MPRTVSGSINYVGAMQERPRFHANDHSRDVLALARDARTVAPVDLVAADAVFDRRDAPECSFEALVGRHNPAHRWLYFSNMTRDEAIVFKTHDSDPGEPTQVPHSAFDDAACPPGAAPRASVEMRAIAYWST